MIYFPPFERCPSCGYSLKGLPLDYQCPECAFVFDSQMVIFRPRSLGPICALIAVPIIPGFLVFLFLASTLWPRLMGIRNSMLLLTVVLTITAVVAFIRISRLRSRGVFVAVGREGISARTVGDLCTAQWDRISILALRDKPPWFKAFGEQGSVSVDGIFDCGEERKALVAVVDLLRTAALRTGEGGNSTDAEEVRRVVEQHLSSKQRLNRGVWYEVRGFVIGGAAIFCLGLGLALLEALSRDYGGLMLVAVLALPVGLVTMMAGLSRLTGGR